MSGFKKYLEKTGEIGRVVGQNNYLVFVSGLPFLKLGEMVIAENEMLGMVHGLDRDKAEILMFEDKKLKIGDRITRTKEPFQIQISNNLLGRIINPLGQPIDGLGPIVGEKKLLPIQRKAPGITQRVKVNKFMETGVIIVDLLVPIGYGQRELIIGDAKTGKTTFLLQSLSVQAKRGIIGIYVGIGKEISAIKTVENYLKEMDISNQTVMVVSTSNNPATLNFLAPFSGMTIAEYFRDQGKEVLIIFDDLTTHAKLYREISLLLNRLPGRNAYPGDIFHIQAAILERAGNIRIKEGKETSITALPVAETLENDISGYIQTNLMAMTDGHIFFDSNEFRKGKLPAINSFLSVSRVGNQTKGSLDQEIANWIRKKMAEYQKVSNISQFGGELSLETQEILKIGARLEILFNQGAKTIIPRPLQLFLFGLLISGFWENKPDNIMKMELKKISEEYKELFFEMENEINTIRNIEELKNFTQALIPNIKETLYNSL